MTTEEYITAIEMRRSRRAYKNKPLSDEVIQVIKEMVDAVNEAANLDFIFVEDPTSAFKTFSGKFSMIAVCGPDSQKARENCGYYGESIVLQCVYHGLGTCWVSGTYNENKVYDMINIDKNKRLYAAVVIGNVKDKLSMFEKTMYKTMHKKNKPYQKMFEICDKKLPDEYISAMKLVEKAPSSVNRRPVKFIYENDELRAYVDEPYSDKSVDFGIAKLHFVLGCRANGIKGKWSEENIFCPTQTQRIKFSDSAKAPDEDNDSNN